MWIKQAEVIPAFAYVETKALGAGIGASLLSPPPGDVFWAFRGSVSLKLSLEGTLCASDQGLTSPRRSYKKVGKGSVNPGDK